MGVANTSPDRRHLSETQRAMAAAKIATPQLGDNQFARQGPPIDGRSLSAVPVGLRCGNLGRYSILPMFIIVIPCASGGAVGNARPTRCLVDATLLAATAFRSGGSVGARREGTAGQNARRGSKIKCKKFTLDHQASRSLRKGKR